MIVRSEDGLKKPKEINTILNNFNFTQIPCKSESSSPQN
jgi:hypothetical protein